MRTFSLRLVAVFAVVLSAGVASAQYTPQPYTGTTWIGSFEPIGPETPGGTYGVFTGVATSAGGLALLEDTAPPVRDDIVPFDGNPDLINDYFNPANDIVRTVTETDVDNGNGTRTFTVTVTGQDPVTGGFGDLWPAGFQTSAGVPLTSGGFGIGLNLPASLGGADPLSLSPGDSIISSTVAISTSGVFGAASNLPSTFFGSPAYPANNWNGVIGISFGNGATGTLIQDGIRLSVTYVVPEPASLSLLGVGALALVRRRR